MMVTMPSYSRGEMPYSLRMDTEFRYDRDRGVLSLIDEHVQREILVRKGVEDTAILQAVLIELERLGYTIISPEGKLLT
jgi:hypothetical protein